MEFDFGPFTLAPEGLRKGAQSVWLPSAALGVLTELVANAPRTVPYPRLAAAGWARAAPSRECIARAVHQLRRALDHTEAGAGRWVETVRTRGYRFAPRPGIVPANRWDDAARARVRERALGSAACLEAERLAALRPDALDELARRYRRARSIDPESPAPWRGLAECAIWRAVARGAHAALDEALAELAAAMRRMPYDARSQACLALAHAVSGGDLRHCSARMERALAEADSDSRVLWYSGLVELCAGERLRGSDRIAAAAFLEPSHERLRRHWLRTTAAIASSRRGLELLRQLDGDA